MATKVSPAEFCAICEVTELTAVFHRPANLKSDYGLVGRIRGAWGNELFRQGPCAEAAFAAFFDKDGSQSKPWCLLVDDHGGLLSVRLRLFGAADMFRQVVFDSLISSLSEGQGLEMGQALRQRRRLRLKSCSWTKQIGVDNPDVPGGLPTRAILDFSMPICLTAGKALSLDYHKFWISALHRMRKIASWHGYDLDDRACADDLRSVSADDSALAPCPPWRRWSGRDRSSRLMRGLIGKLIFENTRESLIPLLGFGQAALVGSDCSFGLGRYDYV